MHITVVVGAALKARYLHITVAIGSLCENRLLMLYITVTIAGPFENGELTYDLLRNIL